MSCPMPSCRPKSRRRSRSRSRKRSRSRSRRRRSRSGFRFGSSCSRPSCGSSRSRLRRKLRGRIRRRGRGMKRRRCYRPGVVTRNPFFNFLREFRKKSCGKSVTQIAKAGAKIWNRMSDKKKCKFMQQAHCAPRRRRRRR